MITDIRSRTMYVFQKLLYFSSSSAFRIQNKLCNELKKIDIKLKLTAYL